MTLLILAPLLVLILPSLSMRRISRKRLAVFLFFICFVLLCGLKDYGGQDDSSYRLFYEQNYASSFIFLQGKEPLFLLLRIIGKSMGLNYKWMFLSYSILAAVFFSKACMNYFDSGAQVKLFSLAFLFIAFPATLTVMRQTVAMAIVFYAYSIPNKNLKKRIVLWTVAILSHYGLILLLPIEVLGYMRKYRVNNFLRVAIPFICLVIGYTNFVAKIINTVVNWTGMYSYMLNSSESSVDGSGVVKIVLILLYLLVVFLDTRYHFTKENSNIDSNEDEICCFFTQEAQSKILWGEMLYLSLILISGKIWGASRIGYYYLFFAPMLVLQTLEIINFDDKSRKIARGFTVVMLYVFFLLYVRSSLATGGYSWSVNFTN